MYKKIPRVMIAGTGSGCGKTSAVCGIMAAMAAEGLAVSPFKCGPDYIDPMFHEKAAGVPSCNLDVYMCGERTVKRLLAEKSENADIAVIEGVMGFYDGIAGKCSDSSSHGLSLIAGVPVILVADCRGRSLSAAAEISGFKNFAHNNIRGVILNGVGESFYNIYKEEIENRGGVKILGYFPKMPGAKIESRRLGLVAACEIGGIKEKIGILGRTAASCVDMASVLSIAGKAEPLEYEPHTAGRIGTCRIGVAWDEAFCFYYGYNLALLEKLGAEIVRFSPIRDKTLPEGLSGLIFGGGYPELWAAGLSGNRNFIRGLKQCVSRGMPLLAECGGFMYLQESLDGFPMAGIVNGDAAMTENLRRFGYIEMTAKKDNVLCADGAKIRAHEFHYSDSSFCGDSFRADKVSGSASWDCVYAEGNIFAGYPHIHFAGQEFLAENFIAACVKYGGGR